jgi:hypothetical protein
MSQMIIEQSQWVRIALCVVSSSILTGCYLPWAGHYYDLSGTGEKHDISGNCGAVVPERMDFTLAEGSSLEVSADAPDKRSATLSFHIVLHVAGQEGASFASSRALISTAAVAGTTAVPITLDTTAISTAPDLRSYSESFVIILPFSNPQDYVVNLPDVLIGGQTIQVAPIRIADRTGAKVFRCNLF